jgi:hypothetical protein
MTGRRTVLLAASLLVGGCARDQERGTTQDSPRATPSTTPAASGAPTAPVVTERGLGPLLVGMTIAEASAALDGALTVPAPADTVGCGYVAWRGGPAGVRVMIGAGRITRVDVDSTGVRTAAGVGIGDSEDQVQRAYPARLRVTPQKYGEGHYLTVTPDAADTSVAIVFETVGGRVTGYRAGQRPQVEYVERCG